MELYFNQVFAYPAYFSLALLVTMLLGIPISKLLDSTARQSDLQIGEPASAADEVWARLFEIPGKLGGQWIGQFERLLFLIAFTVRAPEAIFAWVAFKVAAKWDAWRNVYKIPDQMPKVGRAKVSDAEWLIARKKWGSRTYQRVIIGTAANITAAVVGIAVFQALIQFWP